MSDPGDVPSFRPPGARAGILLGLVLAATGSGCRALADGRSEHPPRVIVDAPAASTDAEAGPESPGDEPPTWFQRVAEALIIDEPPAPALRELGISDPDPDTANFPNGAYVIPKGRVFVETSPVGLYGPSVGSQPTYNWEFLLRYGLTDRVEFRLFSNGLTVQGGKDRTSGFAPLAFDFKVNLWDENRRYFLPATGLEVYIQSEFGSPAFNQGTQPSVSLLFDHTLPHDFTFEWNIGLVGDEDPVDVQDLDFAFQWSLQRPLTESVAAFAHGYVNSPNLPRFGEGVVVGGGAIWYLSKRSAVFGSYNAGVTSDAPTTIFLLGGALAL